MVLWSKLPRKAKKKTKKVTQKHVNIIVNILPLWLNQTQAGYRHSERDLSSVVFLLFNTTEACCGQQWVQSKPQSLSSWVTHIHINFLSSLWFSRHVNVSMLKLCPEMNKLHCYFWQQLIIKASHVKAVAVGKIFAIVFSCYPCMLMLFESLGCMICAWYCGWNMLYSFHYVIITWIKPSSKQSKPENGLYLWVFQSSISSFSRLFIS